MNTFHPLKVTARLGSPVVGHPAFPLDAILLYCAIPDSEFVDSHLPHDPLDYEPEIVPLEQRNPGRDWFYACSYAQWENYTDGHSHWNKRFDDKFADLTEANSVNTSSGRYKAYHSRIQYRYAPEVYWYCVGDPVRIEDLLAGCSGIGKKRMHGWGHVLSWRIREIDEDRSCWWNNRPMRAIPFSYMGHTYLTLNTALVGIRPPYWARDNQTHSGVPLHV